MHRDTASIVTTDGHVPKQSESQCKRYQGCPENICACRTVAKLKANIVTREAFRVVGTISVNRYRKSIVGFLST